MGNSKKILLVRADASHSIGTGHVNRCRAIAQVWQDIGGQVVFVCRHLPDTLEFTMLNEGFKVIRLGNVSTGSKEDAFITSGIAQNRGAKWVVVDGYNFDAMFQKILKEKDVKLLLIDDFAHASHYYADIILNKSLLAKEFSYSKENCTKLLLGPRYTILRNEFYQFNSFKKKVNKTIENILITMGGADPNNTTIKTVRALSLLEDYSVKVRIVAGAAYAHLDTLNEEISNLNQESILYINVDNIAEIMSETDLAITAGGTTLFELAYMQVPSLVIQTVENQRSSYYFDKIYNTCEYLGKDSDVSVEMIAKKIIELNYRKDKRKQMSANGRLIINSKGKEELLRILMEN